MATVTRPATPLPDPGDDMDAEQVRDWMNNVIAFLEGTNIDEANVDLTGSDGIVGKSTAQTIAGQKTFSGGLIATGGALNLTPAAGQAIVLDGTINVDAGVVTGATSITSTAFLGTIDGVLGGNTPAAITGTTIDATTDFTIGSTVITDDSIVMTPSASDTITIAGATNGALSITTVDAAAAAANIQITADGTAELAGTTVTLDSGGGITLDADSGTITFADAGSSLGTITSSGYSGTAALATLATTVTITDNESTNENNAIIFTAGGDLDGGNLGLESDGDLIYNPSTGTVTATIFKGNIDAVDGDFDGTLEADAITLGGTALGSLYSPIAGSSSILTVGTIGTGTWQGTAIASSYVATLNQNTTGTAAIATTVTITDNEDTNETNAIIFTAGGDVDGGNLGLESDGNLTYNPSTGLLSITTLTTTGELDGGSLDISGDADIDGTTNLDIVDIDGAVQIDNTVTIGVDDTSFDFKVFGASAGAFMLYDESTDTLEIRGPSADATTSTGKLKLTTALTNINDGDVLGRIDFAAPLEAGGSVATLAGAAIWAEADATFTGSVNNTELVFATNTGAAATERMRIDASGKVGIGTGEPAQLLTVHGHANIGNGYGLIVGYHVLYGDPSPPAMTNFVGTSDADSSIAILRYSTNSSGPYINFGKSKDASLGIHTPVVDGDVLGNIVAWGSDGYDWDNTAGKIHFEVDGTPSANNMPGAIVFSTNAGAADVTEAMRIDKDGKVGIATASPAHKLDVVGTAGLSTGTAWTNTSDSRIKTNVQTITGALSKIRKLRPVSFKYSDQYLSVHDEIDGMKTYNSFVAEEYEDVFPDAVSIGGNLEIITDEEIDERKILVEDLKQFSPTDLPVYLVAAVQELSDKVDVLISK